MAIRYIVNPGGPTLGLDSGSGLGTIVQDGLTFKDFDRSGQLAPYKDWRKYPEVRAEDLAATFDPDLVEQYGRMVAEEYRALGMTTALGRRGYGDSRPLCHHFGGKS